MSNQVGFYATKPVSLWNKAIKVNFKDMFKSLSKAAVSFKTGKLDNAVKELIGTVLAVTFEEDDYPQLAWILIYNSIAQAMVTLIEEHKELFHIPAEGLVLEELCENIEWNLEDKELCIDKSFFERPIDLPILKEVKKPFFDWLNRGFREIDEAKAKSIVARLESYFVYALNDQWRKDPQRFAKLRDSVDTPFTKASERVQGWMHYNSWLQKQADEPVFGETFSLKQIYIPLRAYYQGVRFKDDSLRYEEEYDMRYVVDMEHDLEQWVNKKDKSDAIKIICGGPGYGKSSFAKIFAAKQAEKGDVQVLFIPLHHFDFSYNLVDAVKNFCGYNNYITHNPLDPNDGDRNLLLIFDGLDELAMQGQIGAEVARNFIREVDKQVNLFNMQDLRLQILISGREMVVQENLNEFRKSEQVLHIIPYYLLGNEDDIYIDPEELLKIDQRNEWWAKYGDITGIGYLELPASLKEDKLVEITSQPLLNYLVALSYTRGHVDFSENANLNAIYYDLLKAVYDRGYSGMSHVAVKGMDERTFVRILEEIAIAAWHGEGRKTTLLEVEAHCYQSGLIPLLEKFEKAVSKGLSRLFIAFYFRHSGHLKGEKTFEFTHKSFGEYLASRRIVRALKRISDEMLRREKDVDCGFDERMALVFWIEVCGFSPIDNYLYKFIVNEIFLQPKHEVIKWQKHLCKLISFMLSQGMPIESLQLKSYKDESSWARNSEEGLLGMLNACALFTGEVSNIFWPTKWDLGLWMKRIHGQRYIRESSIMPRCLSYLNLNNCILTSSDLNNSTLSYSTLKQVSAQFANFSYANLKYGNLKQISAQFANFSYANLKYANLNESTLLNANFINTQATGARIRQSILSQANFEKARLERVNFVGSRLERSNFFGAILTSANLQLTNLFAANFQGALLNGVNLKKANLKGANFTNANLRGADLEGADLEDANLEGADLAFAILKTANFLGANIKNTNFEAANLEGADINITNENIVNLKNTIWVDGNIIMNVN